MGDDLSAYREARDLEETGEPEGDEGGASSSDGSLFVVQEHAASTHHWDFRLEVDGVLRSWSVPKGPSTDPSDRRLAIPTEDHPLEYADFEGVIPEDEYGGGEVIVWDRGRYELLGGEEEGKPATLAGQLEEGHATFALHGEKLRGGYALQRFDADEDEERWLLVKMDDEEADARRDPVSTEPESVLSGETVDSLAEKAVGEGGGEADDGA
ncbi:MAG: DNA polymerase ligase N-terminal domain-containing protein [Gemmatimonadota bacterium]|nr:DNA polymerase ligase N-terminal domain-containing protein [Gemmatimonadota bacterium]